MRLLLRSFLIASAVVSAFAAQAQELVVNGGFETGDLTGWTDFDGTTPYFNGPIVRNLYVHSGSFGGDWGGSGGAWGYQDLATTIGQTYKVSVWALAGGFEPGIGSGGVQVSVGSLNLSHSSDEQQPPWTNLTGTFVATATTTQLGFNLSSNSNGFEAIDDISVQAVPEPASMAALALGAAAILRRRRK